MNAFLFEAGAGGRSYVAPIDDASSKRTDCCFFGLRTRLFTAPVVVDAMHDAKVVLLAACASTSMTNGDSEQRGTRHPKFCLKSHDEIGVNDAVADIDKAVPTKSPSKESISLDANCVEEHPVQESSKQLDCIKDCSDCTCLGSGLLSRDEAWLEFELSVVLSSAMQLSKMQFTCSMPISLGTVLLRRRALSRGVAGGNLA